MYNNRNVEETLEALLEEFIVVRRLLQFMAQDQLRKRMENVISTDSRKKMWDLMDGNLSTTEIAKKTNVSQRAVQLFIKDLEKLELVEMKKRGYPAKTLPIF